MSEKFGARLRQQREAQQISLDTVARLTKIKLTLLEAMEHDDVSAWPGGLFRRAFVRAYAQAIGLDPESAVREFLADFPDRVIRDRWTGSTGPAPSGDGSVHVPASGSPAPRAQPIVRQPIAEPPILVSEEIGAEEIGAEEIGSDDIPAAIVSPGVVSPAIEPEPASRVLPPRSSSGPDLEAVASLCTDLGRVTHANDVEPLVEKFARIVEAKGVIVWVWDEPADALRPAVVHGYPDHVVARLPAVTRDADNPTAEAFRTARPCAIAGRGDATGALVMPMLAPAGCIGTLGIEFVRGVEPTSAIAAVAAIVAAFFSQLVGGQSTADAASPGASRESA